MNLHKKKGRWPEKSVKAVLGLLQNLEANANVIKIFVKFLDQRIEFR